MISIYRLGMKVREDMWGTRGELVKLDNATFFAGKTMLRNTVAIEVPTCFYLAISSSHL
jgi:hypothetical protein